MTDSKTPRGQDGPPGPPFANAVVDAGTTLPPGDLNPAQMEAAIADAVATAALNPSGIGPHTSASRQPIITTDDTDDADDTDEGGWVGGCSKACSPSG